MLYPMCCLNTSIIHFCLQVLQVVDSLAKVHAHSLSGNESVDTFIKDSKDFDQVWAAMVPLLKTVITPLDPEYFGDKLEKLAYIFEPQYSYELMMKLHQTLGKFASCWQVSCDCLNKSTVIINLSTRYNYRG